MINQTLPPNITNIHKHNPFGMRLKSAREALGMDHKEVAAQLRLHEQMIVMIESGEFKSDLPLTFIRGYIRNYSKLMDIPEKELHEALEMLTPKPEIETSESTRSNTPAQVTVSGPGATMKQYLPSNINNFFMQLFTYLLAVTMIALVGIWWHTHKSTRPNDILSETQIVATPQINLSPSTADEHLSSITPAAAAPVPNAENPDSLTPPNVASIPAAPAPAQTAPAPVKVKTQQPLVSKETSHFSFSSIFFNRYTLGLLGLSLFAVIVVAGMRFYSSYSGTSIMAKIPANKMLHRFRPGSIFQYAGKIRLNRNMQILSLLIMVIAVSGIGGLWWWHTGSTSTPVSPEIQNPVAAAPAQENQVNQQTADQTDSDSQVYADIETLAPSPNFNSFLMAHLKMYPLQEMAYQLDNYIAQAAAVKFALTDKSTPMGQFKYKKKSRRHHSVYRHTDSSTQTNGVPPYYYNQSYIGQ